MLIAVISDTHRVAKYINIAKEYIKSADVLIHLGDNSEDIEELTKGFKGKVYGVRGNCDFTNNYPKENIIVLEGKKILITHGDLYGVKYSLTNLYYRAKEVEADIVLFGHSHIPIVEKHNDICLMNPGSISHGACMAKRSLGYIEIKEGKIAQIYTKEIKMI